MAQEVIKVAANVLQEMKAYYRKYMTSPLPYTEFCATLPTVKITAYTSGKVVFQGSNILVEVKRWKSVNNQSEPVMNKLSNNEGLPNDFAEWTIMGSDEVGNGSYFGALAVCAVFIDANLRKAIKHLGIRDSKELTDKQICRLAQELKTLVPYQLTICPPIKYNEVNQRYNANGIKAVLHNFTLLKLRSRLIPTQQEELQGVLVDQFVSESGYYQHLAKESVVYRENVYFAQKGESKHLAVACASIIARAAFLNSLDELGRSFGLCLPSGAGSNVDNIGRRLVQEWGADILPSIAKMHFANTKKILGK